MALFIHLDGSKFDRVNAFSLMDGSTQVGDPANWRRAAEQTDNDHHADVHEALQLGFAATGGCHNTWLLLEKLFGTREYSIQRTAAALNLNPGYLLRRIRRYVERLRLTIARAEAAHAVLDRGDTGFTLRMKDGTFISRCRVLAVSLAGHEERFPTVPTAIEIARYIGRRADLLFGRQDLYLGAWLDDRGGFYCLDVTKLFPKSARAAAVKFARLHRQRAITDLFTLETFWLDDNEQQRPAA